jgi:outer membrane immunogenic protein
MEIRMKKASGVVGAALLLAGPVFAADIATAPSHKVPPVAVVPVYSWTGCYVGGDVGGAWPQQSASVTPSANVLQGALAGDLSNTGNVTGGAYVGCNYQFIPAWVVGLEGDFSWTKLNGSASGPNLLSDGTPAPLQPGQTSTGGVSVSRDTDSLASVRGRLGWVFVPNAMIYGTGGAAWARSNYTGLDVLNTGFAFATSFSDSRIGWVAGGGIDWAPWSNNWVLRFEYLHYQFGGVSSVVTDAASGNSVNFGFGDLKVDTVRAGLSYKF